MIYFIFHESNRMKVYTGISGFSLLGEDGGGVPTHRPNICSFPTSRPSPPNFCFNFVLLGHLGHVNFDFN